MEILSVVRPWDECWGTNAQPYVDPLHPLRIGVHCAKDRHRAYAKVLLAAEALRALGYVVSTEAPCTDPCGCGAPNAWCTIIGSPLPGSQRQELFFQLAEDAETARIVARRTSAMTLAIIRRSGRWGEGAGCEDKKESTAPM